MRLALFLAAALALLGGCDSQTDFAATNPYDPLFDGPRIPTSPDSLRLAASTTRSISLAWPDRSSFETGYLVQRAFGVEGTSFSTIASLPANATSYTDASIDDTSERRYRVLVVAEGERPGVASPALRLQYRNTTTPISGLGASVSGGAFSRTGETVYASGTAGVSAADARTGVSLGALAGARGVVDDVGGERVATVSSSVGPTARVQIFDRTVPGAVTVLMPGGACAVVAPLTVRVADGEQTFVAICNAASGDPTVLGVWGAGGGAPVRTVALGLRTFAVDLSRAGTRAVVAALPAGGAGRQVSGIDVAAGTVLWTTLDGGRFDVVPRFSPDGSRILDAELQNVRLRLPDNGAVTAANVIGAFAQPTAFTFSPDGRFLAVTYAIEGTTVVARTEDLALTLRLDRIRAAAVSLLNDATVVGFRTAGADSDIIRFEAGQNWIVVR